MEAGQIALIRDSWAKVFPIKEAAADLFYDKLFELDPAVRPLFRDDLSEQKRKLVAMLNSIVALLGDATLLRVAEDLGRRHVPYGVRAEHYDTAGTALLWTLKTGLDGAFTPEVEAAWRSAYRTLADAMKAAAAATPATPLKTAA